MTADQLKNSFDSWFSRVNGQSIEREDPTNADQCFDLAFDWVDTLGIPRETIRHFLAYLIYTSPNPSTSQYFEIIPNISDNFPQKGDIVIFGVAVGVAGHVCIATGYGDINSFTSVDQNWDTAHFHHIGLNGAILPYTRQVVHKYNGCLGWLRPKTSEPIPEVITSVPSFTVVDSPAPIIETPSIAETAPEEPQSPEIPVTPVTNPPATTQLLRFSWEMVLRVLGLWRKS